MWAKYQSSIENLEKTATPEPDDGTQLIFTKEHVETFTNPMALCDLAFGRQGNQASPMSWNIDPYEDEKEARSPLNQTIFPDSYLLTWKPVFLIRNPCRAFESMLRSISDVFEADDTFRDAPKEAKMAIVRSQMTLGWTRSLWQFYESKGVSSLIIDADDIVTQPQGITQQLAEWIGFDKDVLKYAWNEATDSEKAAKGVTMSRMLSSLDASAGVTVDASKLAKNIKVDEQVPKWKAEFGDERADMLRECVETAMEDYEWLKERRMRP